MATFSTFCASYIQNLNGPAQSAAGGARSRVQLKTKQQSAKSAKDWTKGVKVLVAFMDFQYGVGWTRSPRSWINKYNVFKNGACGGSTQTDCCRDDQNSYKNCMCPSGQTCAGGKVQQITDNITKSFRSMSWGQAAVTVTVDQAIWRFRKTRKDMGIVDNPSASEMPGVLKGLAANFTSDYDWYRGQGLTTHKPSDFDVFWMFVPSETCNPEWTEGQCSISGNSCTGTADGCPCESHYQVGGKQFITACSGSPTPWLFSTAMAGIGHTFGGFEMAQSQSVPYQWKQGALWDYLGYPGYYLPAKTVDLAFKHHQNWLPEGATNLVTIDRDLKYIYGTESGTITATDTEFIFMPFDGTDFSSGKQMGVFMHLDEFGMGWSFYLQYKSGYDANTETTHEEFRGLQIVAFDNASMVSNSIDARCFSPTMLDSALQEARWIYKNFIMEITMQENWLSGKSFFPIL